MHHCFNLLFLKKILIKKKNPFLEKKMPMRVISEPAAVKETTENEKK